MAKDAGKKSFLDFFKVKNIDDDEDEFDDDLFDDDDYDDDDFDNDLYGEDEDSEDSDDFPETPNDERDYVTINMPEKSDDEAAEETVEENTTETSEE